MRNRLHTATSSSLDIIERNKVSSICSLPEHHRDWCRQSSGFKANPCNSWKFYRNLVSSSGCASIRSTVIFRTDLLKCLLGEYGRLIRLSSPETDSGKTSCSETISWAGEDTRDAALMWCLVVKTPFHETLHRSGWANRHRMAHRWTCNEISGSGEHIWLLLNSGLWKRKDPQHSLISNVVGTCTKRRIIEVDGWICKTDFNVRSG